MAHAVEQLTGLGTSDGAVGWFEGALGGAPGLLAKHFSCADANVTYSNRVDDPAHFTFCMVPGGGADAVLFAATALLVACIASAKLSGLNVLLIGAATQVLAFSVNLGRAGNAISLWLSIQPPETFLYVFLPPLLLDAAVRLDYFIFQKVMIPALTFAVIVVMLIIALGVPIMLYGLGLSDQGWTWLHAALFLSIVASTDAVAVSGSLHSAGAPETISVLLEGESLFNDATSLVMFEIFLGKFHQQEEQREQGKQHGRLLAAAFAGAMSGGGADDAGLYSGGHTPGLGDGIGGVQWEAVRAELTAMAREFAWLTVGGLFLGVGTGYLMCEILRWLQHRKVKPHVEVTLTVALSYLVYYVACAYLEASGVIAVVCFGLYGSASMTFRMSIKAKREHWMKQFWDCMGFIINSLIFFFVGVSSANFMIRTANDIDAGRSSALWADLAWTLPCIYVMLTCLRFLLLAGAAFIINRVTNEKTATLTWKEITFATVGGLRGGMNLILAQALLTLNSGEGMDAKDRKVTSEIGLYSTGFVLMTLLINLPLLEPLITRLGLNHISSVKKQVRCKTKLALLAYTDSVIEELRGQGAEMMRGVDWRAVADYVSLEDTLALVLPVGPKDEDEPTAAAAAAAATEAVPMLRRASGVLAAPLGGVKPPRRSFGAAGGDGCPRGSGPSADRFPGLPRRDGNGGSRTLEEPLLGKDHLQGLPRSASAAEKGHAWLASVNNGGGASGSGAALETAPTFGEELSNVAESGGAIGATVGEEEEAADDEDQHLNTLGFTSGAAMGAALKRALAAQKQAAAATPTKLPATLPTKLPAALGEEEEAAEDEDEHLNTLGFTSGAAVGAALKRALAAQKQAATATPAKLPATLPTKPAAPGEEEETADDEDEHLNTLGFTSGAAMGAALKRALAAQKQEAAATPTKLPAIPSGRYAAADAAAGDDSSSDGEYGGSGGGRGPEGAGVGGVVGGGRRATGSGSGADAPAPRAAPKAGGAPKLLSGALLRAASRRAASNDLQFEAFIKDDKHGNVFFKSQDAPLAKPALDSTSSFGRQSSSATSAAPPHLAIEVASFPSAVSGGDAPPTVDRPTDARACLAAVEEDDEVDDDGIPAYAYSSTYTPQLEESPVKGPRVQSAFATSDFAAAAAAAAEAVAERERMEVEEVEAMEEFLSNLAPDEVGDARRALEADAASASAGNRGMLPFSTFKNVTVIQGAGTDEHEAMPYIRQASGEGSGTLEAGVMRAPPHRRPSPAAAAAAASLSGEATADDGGAPSSDRHGRARHHAGGAPHRAKPPRPHLDPLMVVEVRGGGGAGSASGAGAAVGSAAAGLGPGAWTYPGATPELREDSSSRFDPASASRWVPQKGREPIRRVGPEDSTGPGNSSGLAANAGSRSARGPPGARDRLPSAVFHGNMLSLKGDGDSTRGAPSVGSDETIGGSSHLDDEVLQEYRMRILQALKRYYHGKHEEGLLSAQGLRILDFCISQAEDRPDRPINLWPSVQVEISARGWTGLLAGLNFTLRQWLVTLQTRARWWPAARAIGLEKLLKWFAAMLARRLSRVMMVGMEVALEVWQSLTQSPMAQWLDYAGDTGAAITSELDQQAELAWRFIIDREIEAPDQFQAIQTHRAAMAVLRQQVGFVTQLFDAGMVDEHEAEGLIEPIEHRIWRLELKGPRWTHPSLGQVLANVPFLAGVSDEAFAWFRSAGKLVRYGRDEIIMSDVHGADGLFVVVHGMVRIQLVPEDGKGEPEVFYIGIGGVGGLTSSVLGGHIPGTLIREAYAEGNALGKGPVLFHVSQDAVVAMHAAARAGDPHLAQLALSMFRLAGLFVLDRQKHATVSSIVALLLAAVRADETRARDSAAADAGGRARVSHGTTLRQVFTAPRQGSMRHQLMDGILFQHDGGGRHASDDESESDDGTGTIGGGESTVRSSVLAQQEAELTRGCVDRSLAIFDRMRAAFKRAQLINLSPGESIRQRSSTVILLKGSLIQKRVHVIGAHGHEHNSNTVPTSTGDVERIMPVYKAPSVLLWLPDFLDHSIARFFQLGDEVSYIAGPSGASVLVCDTTMEPAAATVGGAGGGGGGGTGLGGGGAGRTTPSAFLTTFQSDPTPAFQRRSSVEPPSQSQAPRASGTGGAGTGGSKPAQPPMLTRQSSSSMRFNQDV
ncbi:hypothetical protein FOA52_005712 [Chlamydomonas sp. UWO 241]|nr:hypothetical protein FOA52_005712 [Chlamydomonas sp. UWO 241]